jgi:hypothetical protein
MLDHEVLVEPAPAEAGDGDGENESGRSVEREVEGGTDGSLHGGSLPRERRQLGDIGKGRRAARLGLS